DTKRLATTLAMTIAWPVDVQPWWEPSHLAWLKARRLGRAREFYAAVVAARWERAENISDVGVIAALASSLGMNGQLLADAVHDDEIRSEGVEALVTAYEDDIFGVPFFRLGRERFWGFDRVQLFIDALKERADAQRPAAREGVRTHGAIELVARAAVGYDQAAAGGRGGALSVGWIAGARHDSDELFEPDCESGDVRVRRAARGVHPSAARHTGRLGERNAAVAPQRFVGRSNGGRQRLLGVDALRDDCGGVPAARAVLFVGAWCVPRRSDIAGGPGAHSAAPDQHGCPATHRAAAGRGGRIHANGCPAVAGQDPG